MAHNFTTLKFEEFNFVPPIRRAAAFKALLVPWRTLKRFFKDDDDWSFLYAFALRQVLVCWLFLFHTLSLPLILLNSVFGPENRANESPHKNVFLLLMSSTKRSRSLKFAIPCFWCNSQDLNLSKLNIRLQMLPQHLHVQITCFTIN
jgi:hypothetical protein